MSGIGKSTWDMAAAGIIMGGNVRVGFEDNIYLEKGRKAASNGELVAKVVRLANAVPTALAVGHRSDRGRSGKRTADRNSRRPWPHTHERSRSIRIGSRGR